MVYHIAFHSSAKKSRIYLHLSSLPLMNEHHKRSRLIQWALYTGVAILSYLLSPLGGQRTSVSVVGLGTGLLFVHSPVTHARIMGRGGGPGCRVSAHGSQPQHRRERVRPNPGLRQQPLREIISHKRDERLREITSDVFRGGAHPVYDCAPVLPVHSCRSSVLAMRRMCSLGFGVHAVESSRKTLGGATAAALQRGRARLRAHRRKKF